MVKKGFSKKLRYISRTHKVNLGSLREECARPSTQLCYIDTKKQAADIFTKALAPALWSNALSMLGIDVTKPADTVSAGQEQTN